MANWYDNLKEELVVQYIKIPAGIIESAIRRASHTFFKETRLLKDDLYIDMQCKVNDYVLDIPDGRALIQLEGVRTKDRAQPLELADSMWGHLPPASEKYGHGYWADLMGNLPSIMVGSPTDDTTMCVTYSWTPATSTCELPTYLTRKYHNELFNGASWYILLTPTDVETMSPTLAEYYRRQFYAGISNACNDETRNHTQRTLEMTGVPFI